MIELEPVPDKWLTQVWSLGHPAFHSQQQHLSFPARVLRSESRLYADRPVELTTGEKLENLEGFVTLYRGEPLEPKGKRVGVICYHAATPEDSVRGWRACPANFTVHLNLPGRMFEQFVSCCEQGSPPLTKLTFEIMGPIQLGGPEGDWTDWDTKQHSVVPIEGVVFFRRLVRYTPVKEPEEEEEKTVAPEVTRPTFDQLAQGFQQVVATLQRLQRDVGLVFWAAVVIVGVLLYKR